MRLWAFDLRALALLRITYALIILCDLAVRSRDLVAFYCDGGLVPRSALLKAYWWPESWSFHILDGSPLFVSLLFGMHALVTLALLMGYRTRLATWLSWLFMVSLHNRNPLVLDGGDTMLRCLFFWCLFLPWGTRWSLDAGRGENRYWGFPAWGLLLQFSLVYWMAAAFKAAPEWTVDFTAVRNALVIDQLATPRADWLLRQPELMKLLTAATLVFEALGPFLLWCPHPLRWAGALGFSLLHLGFGTFLHLGTFAFIGLVSPLVFWPSFVFDWLENRPCWAKLVGRLPGGRAAGRPLAPLILLLPCAGYIVLLNFVQWAELQRRTHPKVWMAPARLLRLDQRWTMFAPKPLEEDGWFVVDAVDRKGKQRDLFRGGRLLSWQKPARVAEDFPNSRWRKYLMNLYSPELAQWRGHFVSRLLKGWNDTHGSDESITRLTWYFLMEKTGPDGEALTPEPVTLWEYHSPTKAPAP